MKGEIQPGTELLFQGVMQVRPFKGFCVQSSTERGDQYFKIKYLNEGTLIMLHGWTLQSIPTAQIGGTAPLVYLP